MHQFVTSPAVPPPVFSVAQLVAWTGGAWDGPSIDVRGVSQRGSEMPPGGLYVALKGEKHDGHAFVSQAVAAGAAAALVAHDWPRPPGLTLPLLRVDDPRRALAAAAAGWRRECGAVILGLTGSAGKTTTKELVAAMLGVVAPTCATVGNLNNAIGLPLSLLAMPAGTRYGVIEAGSSHPGEIAALAAVLCPDAAILTTIAPAHIEFYASMAAIADEKADLLRAVPSNGFVVLDADGAYFDYLRRQTAGRVVATSLSGKVADYAGRLTEAQDGKLIVTERDTGAVYTLCSKLPGRHHAVDLLLAVAAARALNAPWEAIIAGVADVCLPPMRWERIVADERTVINDAYNANPLSMSCALETFGSLPVRGRRVLVLGDMRELGATSEKLHREIGRSLVGGPWQLLVTVGECARWIAEEAVAGGFPAAQVHGYMDAAAAAAASGVWSKPGDTILLKGSRGMKLECITTAFSRSGQT